MKIKTKIMVLVTVFVAASAHASVVAITNTFTGSSSTAGWVNIGTRNATISYSSGNGPRCDYWDGYYMLVQVPRETSEAAAVIAANGTITGDGMLADGALWFDTADGSSGNESIAYTLDGTMEEGEVITFSYNVFNNNSYWSQVQGQLWDMTTGTELAVADWVTVLSADMAEYKPSDGTVSYTVTAGEAGHKLAIVFREWNNSSSRDPYIDNISVTSFTRSMLNTFSDVGDVNAWHNTGLTNAFIGRTSSADPHWDYWDGWYMLEQPGAEPSDAASIMASGGTITGDGMLADGALWFDVQDGIPGNESIGVTLDGEMEAGEVIRFCYNIFNNNNYYNYTQGQLWDMTTGTLLAVPAATPQNANGWTIVEDNSDTAYKPQDWSVSYTTTVAQAGHKLGIEFREWSNSNLRDPYIDNISVVFYKPKPIEKTVLFLTGENGPAYRIPALITATNGDLFAACDERHTVVDGKAVDLKDSRDIDIVFKRSTDNGVSWSSMEKVCDFGDGYPASDSSLILDKTTGEIFCFYNYMDRDDNDGEYRFYLQRSTDCGATWGSALDFTDQIAKPGWTNDLKFITSGRGIQLQNGDLLHNLVNIQEGLFLFGSMDHGTSWELIDVPVSPANESKVVELTDGSWMINSRVDRIEDRRWVHMSEDQGQSWSSSPDSNLVDPGCNASIIQYTSKQDGYARDRLLFSNVNNPDLRKNLTIRISYDEGKSWSAGKVVESGVSAYSSLSICEDGSIAMLYERDGEIVFARLTLEDLTDGKDTLFVPYQL